MKLGWLSDVHLNFLDDAGRSRFFDDLSARDVDAWLLSGDIGEAGSVVGYLREFENRLTVPSFFVLGNHDFYNGSLAQVRADVSLVNSSSDSLVWLTETGPKKLDDDVALVGDDCWSDARLGNPMDTPVELNDFYLIKELSGHTRAELVRRLNQLGAEASARLSAKLDVAAARCANVVVIVHPPPFEGATWHEGKISSPDWLPWFTCESAGTALESAAATHLDTNFIVLCGHTHSGGLYSPSPNMTVRTASAEYGRPAVQAVLEFEKGTRPRVA